MTAARRGRLGRTSVTGGALALGAGLGILGLSAYAFLGLAARGLDLVAYAELSVLWTLYNVVGPGLFSPMELEVGRAVADRRARGVGAGPVIRRAAQVCVAAVAILVIVTIALSSVLSDQLLGGSELAVVALLIGWPAAAAAYLSRGVLAGHQRFARYAVQLGLEGVLRTLLAVLLFVAAVQSAGAYGLLLGVAALVAVGCTVPWHGRSAQPGPPAPWGELGGALGWLLTTSLLGQLLVNSGPVVVALSQDSDDRLLAGPVLAGIVLTRLPLFLFTAVQAVLLPRMADLLGRGELAAFKVQLSRLLLLVAGVGAAGCLAAGTAGPILLRLAFGEEFRLSGAVLAGMALASALYMVAVVLNHSLIALQAYASATLGWVSGVVVFGAALLVADTVLGRAVWSYAAGCGAVVVCLAVLLLTKLRVAALAEASNSRHLG